MPIVWISICQAVFCLFFLSQNSRNKMTYWAKKAVVFPTTLALKEDLDYVLTMICTILAEIICPFPGKYGLRKWEEVNKWGSEFQCCMYILFKWLWRRAAQVRLPRRWHQGTELAWHPCSPAPWYLMLFSAALETGSWLTASALLPDSQLCAPIHSVVSDSLRPHGL